MLLRRVWPVGSGLADSIALGMGVWMAYVFSLAALSVVSVGALLWSLAGVLVGLAIWGLPKLRRPRSGGRAAAWWTSISGAEAICAVAIALVLAALLVRAAYPSVAWDAAVYHLTLPKLMLQQGGFALIERNFQSFWPVNGALRAGARLGGPGLASMMHWASGCS